MHPTTARLIGELGIRYRPSVQADLVAHAEALRFLSEDLADAPVLLLERACRQWSRENRFMPKASELLDLCHKIEGEDAKGNDHGFRQLQAHADRLNGMGGIGGFWFVAGEAPNRRLAQRKGGE